MKLELNTTFLFSLILLLFASCQSTKDDEETDFCSAIKRDTSYSLSRVLDSVDPFTSKNGTYVLEDGAGSMVARAWLTEYAEKTIDIQYFIFSTDNVGLIACDYLVKAADRGIKIRIIVDDILIDAESEDIAMFASHENIDVKIYNPGINLGKNLFQKIKKLKNDFRSANQRMHNKTFIVDGKIVITGGRNIADEYFDYDHEYNFRDRDVLLIGDVTKKVEHSFEQFWSSNLCVRVSEVLDIKEDIKNPNRFESLHQYACNPDNFWPQVRDKIKNLPSTFGEILTSHKFDRVERVDFISDIPGKNEEKRSLKGGGITTDTLINLIKNARSKIEIQTPYLVTTDLAQNLFREAIERGVDIRIMTNSLASTDNVEAFSGYQRDREKLLKLGIRIFEYKPDAAIRREIMTGELQQKLDHKPIFGLHAKTMIIDDYITVIGTFNLDPRSANLNTECLVIIKSEKIASSVLAGMEEEFKPENCWETTLEFNPDSEVGRYKRAKTWTRKVIPKGIL